MAENEYLISYQCVERRPFEVLTDSLEQAAQLLEAFAGVDPPLGAFTVRRVVSLAAAAERGKAG